LRDRNLVDHFVGIRVAWGAQEKQHRADQQSGERNVAYIFQVGILLALAMN
jgi:hypothetical protein